MPPTGEREGARVHDLKVWPGFFEKLLAGEKTFEVRKDDRGFRAGDVLNLREWDRLLCQYTGREMRREVACLMSGMGIEHGYVVLGLAAAPAQPGEGEVWDVLQVLVDAVDAEIKDMERQSPASPWTAQGLAVVNANIRARALLERRGGKGLSGKGER